MRIEQIALCSKEINNEIELIDQLLESHDSLFKKLSATSPNRIELSAIATVLHSFYNGVENIFHRIATRLDEELPSSSYWHQELLQQMKSETSKRSPVISQTLYERLNLYLGFRHFFRHSYAFQLKWEKVKDLILDLPDVYGQFKDEVTRFIQNIAEK